MSNNFGLISAASLHESAEFTLDEAKSAAQHYLSTIASSEDFVTKIAIAFGDSFDAAKAEGLRQEWLAGDFDSLPAIEVHSEVEINGANGAFSADTNKIYLSQEYITQNASNPQAIATVLLEEIGHFVDWQLNEMDSPGDEGAIFSALVFGNALEEAQLQSLKVEDDTAYIVVDSKVIAIEQSAPPTAVIEALQYTDLISDQPARWADNTITYNFLPSFPALYHLAIQSTASLVPYGGAVIGSLTSILAAELFSPFSNAQKIATQKALGLWSEVANVDFVLKDDTLLYLADLLDLGLLEFSLESVGLWDDFTEQIEEYIGQYIGFPVTDGADTALFR